MRKNRRDSSSRFILFLTHAASGVSTHNLSLSARSEHSVTQLICGTADKKAKLEIFAARDQPNLEATVARLQASNAATRD